MTRAGVPAASGPFRGLVPYDESAASLYFGRASESERLFQQVIREGHRTTALTGQPGAGKTSLLRAGLTPRLVRNGTLGIYIGGDTPIEQEILAASTRAGAEPPTAGESPTDYLVRVSHSSRAGTVLILDHLERALASEERSAALVSLLASAASAAGPRLRFVFCIDSAAFPRLDRLIAPTGLAPAPGAWHELEPLAQEAVEQIFEQTALQTGTFLETGLAALIAGDLCRGGPCWPLDLQLLARAVVEQRLTTVRRYERAGGATLLIPGTLERAANEAGGTLARHVLGVLERLDEGTAETVAERVGVDRAGVDQALAVLAGRGFLRKRTVEREERFALAHPALARHVGELTAIDRFRSEETRRRVRSAMLAGRRLGLRELLAAKRRLAGALTRDEAAAVRRGTRRATLEIAAACTLLLAFVIGVILDGKRAYTLGLTSGGWPEGGRVVVRGGRSLLPFTGPTASSRGQVLVDTGFSTSALAPDFLDRIRKGQVTGTFKGVPDTSIPPWLRSLIDALKPISRGVSMVLLGDPAGITSLKQGFADPGSRREALECLAVIGNGRAGEDEILGAALGDPSPEVRRRAVEVAAAIDRRLGKGSHVATLRTALADAAAEVKATVLRECASLPPTESAEILAVALSDKDSGFRRLAEQAVIALAARAPGAAAQAVMVAVRSPDGTSRRNGIDLLEQLAATAPAEIAATLADLLADAKAPEEVRIAVLTHLRQSGQELTGLKAVLETAARAPESSPRLKAAALPLYARLIDPAAAEAMALADARGAPAQRAAAAAIWGAIAQARPDLATRALKGSLYDPSPEVRIEAARSFGSLKREGPLLVQKALLDPNADVMRAALASAVDLAPTAPYVIGEALGRAFKLVRPGLRRPIVETMGRIGKDRPAAVVAPLARAFKEGDGGSRAAAAMAFCVLARKAAEAVSPYLRLAARDPDRDVRAAAAGCLSNLGAADPKAASRLAAELAASDEPAVRAAAAKSLGELGAAAREATLPPLLRLLQDPDRSVRAAALAGLRALARTRLPLERQAEVVEKALLVYMREADTDERRKAVEAGGEARLVAVLRQGAGDVDESVRLEAVARAGNVGPAGQEVLQAAVEDRSTRVRAEAVRHLALTRGEGARKVLPVFQGMLRSSDLATRRAGVAALGDLADTTSEAAEVLAGLLQQRSETIRADAAEALGRLTARDSRVSTAALEAGLDDPAHDVRNAALRALAGVWSRRRTPAELAQLIEGSEADSSRRLVALEALVLTAEGPGRAAALQHLEHLSQAGPPMARLVGQVGYAFALTRRTDIHAFLERLLGG